MKKNLDQTYLYEGKFYGPGEAELPDDILDKPGLSPAFKAAIERDKAPEELAQKEGGSEGSPGTLEDVDGIGPEVADQLYALGYRTPKDLESASDEELLEVAGIGPAKLAQIREQL